MLHLRAKRYAPASQASTEKGKTASQATRDELEAEIAALRKEVSAARKEAALHHSKGHDRAEDLARQLNGRPRKTLGWKTPAERLRDLLTTT